MNLSWLLRRKEGINVLMYHRISEVSDGELSVSCAGLRKQLIYLAEEGYRFLSLTDFIEIANSGKPVTEKSVLITFDDGYEEHYTYAYPLIKQLGVKATFFIIANTLGSDSHISTHNKMTLAQLQVMDPAIVQLAMHGYTHEIFAKRTLPEITGILQKSLDAFTDSGLPFHRVLAYPFGSVPVDRQIFEGMKKWMQQQQMPVAFATGNRVATLPLADKYKIDRIHIGGTDTIEDFIVRMKKGKLKPVINFRK